MGGIINLIINFMIPYSKRYFDEIFLFRKIIVIDKKNNAKRAI